MAARTGVAFPGQDDLRAPPRRLVDALRREYARLRGGQELLLRPCADPGLHATDLPDWGSALLACVKLGDRARVLVDAGARTPGGSRRAGRRGPARRAVPSTAASHAVRDRSWLFAELG